jgi:hypothetical protein
VVEQRSQLYEGGPATIEESDYYREEDWKLPQIRQECLK